MRTIKNISRWILISPYYALVGGLNLYESVLYFIRPSLADIFINKQSQRLARKVTTINHITTAGQTVKLTFSTPNVITKYRANTFSSKEPETLSWIDQYGGKGAFFDIGANVGIYSLYHAATHPNSVYAFEPSGVNIGILAKNININHFQDRISVVQTPLSDEIRFSDFHMSNTDEGSALSSFGATQGHDGQQLHNTLFYRTFGLTLDYLVSQNIIREYPALIKIDVDGIENAILEGSRNILKNPKCKTILVEVNLELPSCTQIENTLSECGFILQNSYAYQGYSPIVSEMIVNQIWIRP